MNIKNFVVYRFKFLTNQENLIYIKACQSFKVKRDLISNIFKTRKISSFSFAFFREFFEYY